MMSDSPVTLDAHTHKALQLAQLSLDRARDAVFFLAEDARIFYANEAACHLLGYERDALLQLHFYDIALHLSPESWQTHWQAVRNRSSTTLEFVLQRRSQRQLDVEANLNHLELNGDAYQCAIVRDITERKRDARNLYRAKEQLRAILDAVPGFVSWISRDGRYLQVNRHLADSYGMPPESFVGKELGFLQNSPQFADCLRDFALSEEMGLSQIIEADVKGTRRHYLIAAQKCDGGNATVVVGIDITERKQAAEALQRSKDHLRAVLDAVPGFVSWIGGDRRYLGVNRFLAESYGMPPEAFVGKELGFLKNSPQFVDFMRAFVESDRDGRSQVVSADVKGVKRSYLIAAQKYDRGQAAVAVGIDITERKQATEALERSEAQLREQTQKLASALRDLKRAQTHLVQAEKMSALGQTVAGIAHEINNPISFIYGNLDHAQQYARDLLELIALYQQHYAKPPPEIYERLDRIDLEFLQSDLLNALKSMRSGADRIQKLVISLRNFARLDESSVKLVDLHPGIESTLVILNHRLQNIAVEKNYGELPRVTCYPALLNQVWLHLLANALDALDEVAKQQAKAGIPYQPSIFIRTEALKGDRVRICIGDNGPGISEEMQAKIFDPFFTTKPVGKGTGLGLSICYQAIEEHNGTIAARLRDGGGTEFEIVLPVRLQESKTPQASLA